MQMMLTISGLGLVALLGLAWHQTERPSSAVTVESLSPLEARAPRSTSQPARPVAPQETTPPASQPALVFAENAFPPPIPDTASHKDAWLIMDCLRCHETGVGDAPMVIHATVPAIALDAKCRTCHVLIPGLEPRQRPRPADPFLDNAFPPMIPASDSHRDAWTTDTCLLCHTNGIKGAPLVRHEGMPPILLEAKCRSCHVQVRSSGIRY